MTRYRPIAIILLSTVAVTLICIAVLVTLKNGAMRAIPSSAGDDGSAQFAAENDGVIDGDDGVIGDMPISPFANSAAITGLDSGLRDALQSAATSAEADGIDLTVTSGWRSAEHQQELLDEAVLDYGSIELASQWVATPQTSAHVRGEAVDVGPTDAYSWLIQWGAEYGLCNVYANEPWHFELVDVDADGYCPAPFSNPTEDPRMQNG